MPPAARRSCTTAYTPGEKDYSSLVSRLKQAGVSVIYVGGYHTEAGLIIRQAKEQGMKATLVGGDALVTKRVLADRRRGRERHDDDVPARPAADEVAADVVKEFKAKKIDPEGYVLYTYAAVQVWADAVKKANTTDPKKVAAALKAGGQLAERAGPGELRQEGRHHRRRLRVLCLEEWRLRADVVADRPLGQAVAGLRPFWRCARWHGSPSGCGHGTPRA